MSLLTLLFLVWSAIINNPGRHSIHKHTGRIFGCLKFATKGFRRQKARNSPAPFDSSRRYPMSDPTCSGTHAPASVFTIRELCGASMINTQTR